MLFEYLNCSKIYKAHCIIEQLLVSIIIRTRPNAIWAWCAGGWSGNGAGGPRPRAHGAREANSRAALALAASEIFLWANPTMNDKG